MSPKNKTVAIITKNSNLVILCNNTLGRDFCIIWIEDLRELKCDENLVAVITDCFIEDFETIFSFYQQKNHIRCFYIQSKNQQGIPEPLKRNFPKAKFLDIKDIELLKLSIESEYHLSPWRQTSVIDEYYRKIHCAATSDENVLLLGGMGAGKTHDAQLIHNLSHRKNKEFVHFNIAESNPDSIEGDLFGVAKHSYTGVEPKDGLLRKAQGGTLFFDEIAEIPMEIQSKLLNIISERKFRQKGSDREEKFTGRFIFATNANLAQLVEEKKFRSDLYCRINVLRITVPELNDREDDIEKFAIKYASEKNKKLTKAAIQSLIKFKWSGNIRQLRNIVVRACTFASGNPLQPKDFTFD